MAKAAAGGKKKVFRKKEKKNIPNGIVYIAASFNNTMISITDLEGNLVAHQLDEGAALGPGQARVAGLLGRQIRVRAPLVIVGGEHQQALVQAEELAEEALVQLLGIAAG